MKMYNQEILSLIYSACEKSGDTHNVGPEYYNGFLNIGKKGFNFIIECIVRERADYINRQCMSHKWTSDEEIFEHIMDFLEMLAQGIMCIREKDGVLVFFKPVGPPPDAETEMKIDQKIQSARSLIRKVISKALVYRNY
jgi:hypothetical protein